MVVLNKDCEDECIGIYAGRRGGLDILSNSKYLFAVFNPDPKAPKIYTDGDNILSMMNTSYDCDKPNEHGLPYRQKEGGYTVKAVPFKATFEDGTQSYIAVMYVTGKRGQEARWNYKSSPREIQEQFHGKKTPRANDPRTSKRKGLKERKQPVGKRRMKSIER